MASKRLRLSFRLFSLPNRVLMLCIGPALISLLGLAALLLILSVLSEQTRESERARLAMESARTNALQIERSRALLHELFAASVRGDLQALFRIRNEFDARRMELESSGYLTQLQISARDLAGQPDQVLDAAEAMVQRDAPAASAIMETVDAEMSAIVASLDELSAVQSVLADQARTSALRALQMVGAIGLLLLVVAFIGALVVVLGMERLVRRPLADILHRIENIRSGSLTAAAWSSASVDPAIERIHDALGALAEHEIERKQTMSQLEHLARFDDLTSLPNRVLLSEQLSSAMAKSREQGRVVGVIFIDLDEFKEINDAHGHAFGDHVLIALAKRMRSIMREGDTLARMGGDEFVAVLPDLDSENDLDNTLDRLMKAVCDPVEVKGILARVTASAGVTTYPQHEDIDADQLLRQADQAMYRAKQQGKRNFARFDPDQDREVREQHELVGRVHKALLAGNLVLYYQPKVDLLSGQVVGAEALIRWQDPERGLVSPAEFLPAVENHRLAITIGEWVLDQALRDCLAWHAKSCPVPVAVNVFPLHLQQPDFIDQLTMIMARHERLDPGLLELEIVETAALSNIQQASSVIKQCAELGLKVALDDFGTGYSSLTYLRRLPVTDLKLDQSFVRGMLNDRNDLVIIQAVLDLANAFGLKVIAEGVETIEHGQRLIDMGCRFAQGYAIARPMPASELESWVRNWSLPEAWRLEGTNS